MKKLLFFLLLTPFIYGQVLNSAEKSILLNLYNQTGGDNWNRTWDLTEEPAKWFGVKISNGSVVELNLNGNLLEGDLPSLSGLSNLQVLDLSSNHLSGNTNLLNSLTALEKLDISKNDFTGDISSELGGLSNLTELNLGGNSFTLSEPDSFLSQFPNLETLDLSGFQLTSVPQKISTFSSLKTLQLADNSITDFSNLSSLTGLENLNISGNQLQTIPTEINTLINLISLDLSNNLLNETKVQNLSYFKNLEWLSLEQNQFANVPSVLGQLTKMVHLNLGRNLITGGFSNISSLPVLQQLFLNNNLIEGDFPTELLDLNQLMMISLRSNLLTGNLPDNLPFVTDVSNNRYQLSELKTYLALQNPSTELIYSPQMYDETTTVNAAIGSSAALNQSLSSGDGYQFSWFKNLDSSLNSTTSSHTLYNIQDSDFLQYTCEAYFLETDLPYLVEVAFFREPITLEKGDLGTDETEMSGIIIYPNPTSDFINIQHTNNSIDRIAIYDLSGKQILTSYETRINVAHFPTGSYILTVKTKEGNIKSFKFIKK